ncbi:hypothetical protein C8F04DRAFT_62795 [Mycena alexandri]|uniref:F-box domain-containing protein n=1 Tax=Mycena alexandri TaxID=1745969 RepID=A0AAD6SMU5_9AGAR|nr:hypothetical protein C8F04DRAFT_62795 [Mycena alexandri]
MVALPLISAFEVLLRSTALEFKAAQTGLMLSVLERPPLESQHDALSHLPPEISRLATSLCRICRRWREIALSTPKLWRANRIEVAGDYEEQDMRLELLGTWLSRSGHCPLSLSLTGYVGSNLLRSTLLYCRRWEQVEICIPFEHLHLIQHFEMPLLRDLTFGPCDYPSQTADEDFVALELFDRALQLKAISLTRYYSAGN